MDNYVPQQLPFALRAFQLSRLPVKVLETALKKKKYKLLVAGGILVGSTALWKLGTHRSHSNYDPKMFVYFHYLMKEINHSNILKIVNEADQQWIFHFGSVFLL